MHKLVFPIMLVLFMLIAPAVSGQNEFDDIERNLEIIEEMASGTEMPMYIFAPGVNVKFLMGVPGGEQGIDVVEVMKDGWVRIYLNDTYNCACGLSATVQVGGVSYKSSPQPFDGDRGVYLGVKTPELKEGRCGYDELNIIVGLYDSQLVWQGQMIID